MRADKQDQTIDLKTLKLHWNKARNDWQRSSIGDIHYVYIERPSGQRRSFTTGQKSEPAAAAWVRDYKAGLQGPIEQTIEPTFAEVIEAYALRKPNAYTYLTKARNVLTAFHDRTLSSISEKDLTEFETQRLKQIGRNGKKLDRQTLRGDLGALKTIRKFAIGKSLIPADKIGRLIKIDQPEAKERSEVGFALDDAETDELWSILMAAHKPGERLSRAARWGAIAIDTGARRASIQRLKWSQVDFKARLIRFSKDPRLDRNGHIPRNKRAGDAPITPRLEAVLRQAYAERFNDFVCDKACHVTRAFAEALAGTQFGTGGARRVFPHILRHSWVTNMIKRGNSVEFIADIIKDDPVVLRKVYSHLLPEWIGDQMKWGPSQLAQLRVAAE